MDFFRRGSCGRLPRPQCITKPTRMCCRGSGLMVCARQLRSPVRLWTEGSLIWGRWWSGRRGRPRWGAACGADLSPPLEDLLCCCSMCFFCCSGACRPGGGRRCVSGFR